MKHSIRLAACGLVALAVLAGPRPAAGQSVVTDTGTCRPRGLPARCSEDSSLLTGSGRSSRPS
jgi:hypothetical protein